jgi:N-acyl-D-aspartate/D-glutamate deacylase
MASTGSTARASAAGTFVLRGGTVVDGSGAPGAPADVLVRDGVISTVGVVSRSDARDATEVDVGGSVVAPGFIDLHTHYDAQVLWDPDLSPSSWHGVTTVVMGNCGFSIAPTTAEGREAIIGTLENVEDMAPEALREGVRWEFESFPEYLDLLDRVPKRLNVGAMIGHSALRLFVMGDDAIERQATPNEIRQMQAVLGDALAAGAMGFATSRSASHVGHLGKPVASRVGGVDELLALVDAVDASGRGVIEIAAGAGLDEVAQMAGRCARPLMWSSLLTGRYAPKSALDMVDETTAIGSHVSAQISCRPLVLQVTLLEPRGFVSMSTFAEIVSLPVTERAERYRSAEWRERARAETSARWGDRWPSIEVDESPTQPELVGSTLAEIARARGGDAFDAMLDVALTDDLRTRFTVPLLNDDETELGALLRDTRTVLGLSDAGAHASQLCDACFSTHLLGHWVRQVGAIPLELAVWRLTGQPAELLGLTGRGLVRPGHIADLVVFDPDTVQPGRRERVRDQPGGTERLVVHAEGIEHVWVNGGPIVAHGTPVDGATTGRLLRS